MKTILRNFFFVLRRFKMATILNVLGLSVAYVAFILIMIQVNFDKTFDCYYPNAEAIFRLDVQHREQAQAVISRPYARSFIKSSPHIKSGCIMDLAVEDLYFQIEKEGQRMSYKEKGWTVSPEFIDVFQLDMIEGDEKALEEPLSVIVPESMAKKWFGNESALNKQLHTKYGQRGDVSLTIKGVYRDFPMNVSLQNTLYARISDTNNNDNWNNWNYATFVRLDDPKHAALVKENFEKSFAKELVGLKDVGWLNEMKIRLTSLPELHFVKGVVFDNFPKASSQVLLVLFSIGFVILIIAGINFTNFSTALTPMRIKSINTQKVLGSSVMTLRNCLLLEAVCISVFAYLLALLLLEYVKVSPIVSLIDADLVWSNHWKILAGTGLLAIVLGILAGLYPSYYVTSFPPALVLKGSFGLSPEGRKMRSLLIGIQYVAVFVLIIGSLFMYLQNYYMQHAPLGYDKEEVIVARLNWGNIQKEREALTNQLKSSAGVKDVTYSEILLSSGDQYMQWGRDYKNGSITFQCIPVTSSFLKIMGVKVNEGRDFRSEDELKDRGCFIFNETARAKYDLQLGDKIGGDEVVGFIPDVKFASFRQEISPMAFYVWGKSRWGMPINYDYVYVKFNAGSDLQAGIEHVRKTLAKFDSDYPFDIEFYDEVFQTTYEKELKMGALITLFSLVAIFISIVGVFGLVVFESEYRRKEIAIRKVLGSTTGQILFLFNRGYLLIISICFAIGVPIAWYGIHKWLENFAYRIPLYWWVFPLVFVLVGLVTTITVTFQNWQVANENPVKNIKLE
ncbi:MAG: ABC transporter permease [Parabacteroides sp.]|nr:ABC transporter permease [Parabacteroides sp.]